MGIGIFYYRKNKGLGKSAFSWNYSNFWIWLFIYGILALGGAQAMYPTGEGPQGGFVGLVFLTYVGVCMWTERGEWKVWKRIGFVFLAWFIQVILQPSVAFSLGILIYRGPLNNLLEAIIPFAASIPVLVFAMWHSRLFVRPNI